MKSKIKKIIIFIYCIVIAFSLTSCDNKTPGLQSQPWSSEETSETTSVVKSSSEKEDPSGKGDLWADRKLTVGYIGPGTDELIYTFVNNLNKVSEEWNIELKYYDGQGKDELQKKYLLELIEQDVDIIGVTVSFESGWDEVLKKAKDSNIPIILIDKFIDSTDESLWAARIVPDNHKEGKMAGEWLINYLEQTKQLDNQINIVEIAGLKGAYTADERGQGFREAIEGYENLEIIKSIDGSFNNSGGYEIIKTLYATQNDLDILFIHNDHMTLGAIAALEEFGIIPGKDVILINIVSSENTLKAIVDGKIACSVECNPLMGDLFMEACVRLANGETIQREIHPVDRVFDITNAQAELDARKENGYGY